VTWQVYAMVAAGLAIIYLSAAADQGRALAAGHIVVLTAVAITLDLDIRTCRRHGRDAGQPAGVPAAGHAR
jgi:SulP family sulfate permease